MILEIQFETDTFANLDTQGDDGPHDDAYGYYTGITAEKDEIVNIIMNSTSWLRLNFCKLMNQIQ